MPFSLPNGFANMAYSHGHSLEVELSHVGQGNWRAFRALGVSLPDVMAVARSWSSVFAGIERPWLCWSVNDEWSIVQQRLALSVGWTPVVGFDPRSGAPQQSAKGAIVIDFNHDLCLPVLYPHFLLEFAFLFCDRLAFWHSDLLVGEERMRATAATFQALKDGQTAAVRFPQNLKSLFSRKQQRYWELVGCTTRAASRGQFEAGCGWWMDFWAHPNQPDGERVKATRYWDHGSGILYWREHEGGKCVLLNERDFRNGHFTKIGNSNYKRFREADSLSDARRSMAFEIRENFDLAQACRALGLQKYLAQ